MKNIFLILLLTVFGQTTFAQNKDNSTNPLIEQAQQAEQNNDFSKAFNLYQKASKQKDAFAQYKLASLYERGLGTDRNLRKAEEYYKLSAKTGDPNGLYEMGNWKFYYNPAFYVETKKTSNKNIGKALMYYQKAKDKGNENAAKMIALMEEIKQGKTDQLQEKLNELFHSEGINKDSIVLQQNLLYPGTERERYMYNWKLFNIYSTSEELMITLVCNDEDCALLDNRTIYLPLNDIKVGNLRPNPLPPYTRVAPVINYFGDRPIRVEDYESSDFNGEEMNMITESDMTPEELARMKLFNRDYPYHKLVRINRILELMGGME